MPQVDRFMGFRLWRLLFFGFARINIIFHSFTSSEGGSIGSFMHEATSAPTISFYDYIIVGGGTAGCSLAATLSRNSTVLVLERGGSPYGNPNITYLSAFGGALLDLSRSSPAQRFISEDGVFNSRARVLGGGTSINAGFYSRASDGYVAGAGWDPRLVEESYRWVEKAVVFKPTVRQWQAAVRDGLLEAGVVPYNGFTYDHLIGTKIGGTIFDGDERRHTAAELIVEYADFNRLTVLLNATVQKILFTTRGKERPSAEGVIFKDAIGENHTAYLKPGPNNEVILSAGAIGSPQLLMLSGIGPMGDLQAHNITVVMDQPSVGQGMGDNPMNAIYVPSPTPVEVSLVQVAGISQTGNDIEAISGRNFTGGYTMLSPQIEMISAQDPDPRALQGGFILAKVQGPLSRGYLKLKNKDPNDNPLVRFNYFNNSIDLERCVYGLKIMANIVDSNAFKPFVFENYSLPYSPNDTISLERYCRLGVRTLWHYHGGCQVGRVVDHDYKVFGVDALRVVDGSTFNTTPGTNPQATVMMLGRYVGVKMLNERIDVSRKSDS
ncbi:protein HOTHEAD-like [Salvia hispanica]|uniref:protein HOTHEAD-like n=1 Tax=Salvia hispanica TaxID=49212 RepID=UPI0020099CCD|nr:protein HOTHEAD-like [Salvia hispanica]